MLKSIYKIALVGVSAFMMQSPSFAAATKDQAVQMVSKAADYLKSNGKEKLLSEINTKGGQFHQDDLYAFAYDINGTNIAHPINPALIGKNLVNTPDVNGKLFRKEIVDAAKSKGSGWVDYTLKNPESGKIENKTTYFQRVDDLIIAAGVAK